MPSPQPQSLPPAEEQLLETDSFALEVFWERHRITILLLIAALLVAGVAVIVWLVNQHNTRLAAEAAFATASGPEAWKEVIAQYPDSPQAANSHLLLGAAQREAGDLEASTKTFQDFLARFPKNQLVGEAWLGLAANQALEGNTQETITILKEIQAEQADSYVAPYAALVQGRMAVREGDLVEARKIFSALVATYPQSPVARIAGAQVDELIPFLPPKTESTESVAPAPASDDAQ